MKRSRRSDNKWANGNLAGQRSKVSSGSLASLVLEADELDYMMKLKDILEAFPNKGPPFEPSQLCPHVFIGSQRNADDFGLLRRLGITHVVNCCANRKLSLHLNPYPRITGIFRFIAFPAEDQTDYDILQHLPEILDFLEHCKRNNGRALIHCNLGINRSGAICASYIMLDQQMPLLKVCELLKKKRSVVLTNKGFRRQLVKFARTNQLLDRLIETRPRYLPRSGSVSVLPEYSERVTDIAPGEINTSRPLSRTPTHYRTQSTGRYRPSNNVLQSFPAIQETQSAPPTPTRFHPAYCTLPRSTNTSNTPSNKRSIAASHYDQDYFMDTIPEDNLRHPKEADTPNDKAFAPPSRHYLINIPKLSTRKSKDDKKRKEKKEEESEWVVSSTRPLRIYKRSSTDSVLYQKPMHTYKRADTVATTDLTSEMDSLSLHDSGKLTEKHRSSSRTSLASLSSGFFNKFRSRSRMSLQNF